MEKLIILLIIFIGPIILKAIKKSREENSSRGRSLDKSSSIRSSSNRRLDTNNPSKLPKEQNPLDSFFNLFEEEDKKIEEQTTIIEQNIKESKEAEEVFYEDIKNKNFDIEKTETVEKKRKSTNALHKIEKYGYLKRAMVYKEIFDLPVSMKKY